MASSAGDGEKRCARPTCFFFARGSDEELGAPEFFYCCEHCEARHVKELQAGDGKVVKVKKAHSDTCARDMITLPLGAKAQKRKDQEGDHAEITAAWTRSGSATHDAFFPRSASVSQRHTPVPLGQR
jgi:hypothetical protein